MPTREQVLDEILPTLADNFEAGNQKYVNIGHTSADNFEPIRECLAALMAEGSLESPGTGLYRFTANGYSKYKPRIDAVRAMPGSNTTVHTAVALTEVTNPEQQRQREIVREALSKFDNRDRPLFQFISDIGEISVKALAQAQKFGPNLYHVLDRAVRANLLRKQVREGHTTYSINPQLKSALDFVLSHPPA